MPLFCFPAGTSQNPGYFCHICWFSSSLRQRFPILHSLNAYRSCANAVMMSRSSSGSSYSAGIAFTPCKVPSRLRVIDPVESESPSWFTARMTPCLKSRATRLQ